MIYLQLVKLGNFFLYLFHRYTLFISQVLHIEYVLL